MKYEEWRMLILEDGEVREYDVMDFGYWMKRFEIKKLNIGSGFEYLKKGYLNLDDGSEWVDEEREFLSWIKKDMVEKDIDMFVLGDGNKMLFMDGLFDEVYSGNCVGMYVESWDEVLRVLKVGGVIKLCGGWNEKGIMKIKEGLESRGCVVEIESIYKYEEGFYEWEVVGRKVSV